MDIPKILGQKTGSAAAEQDLYTCPASTATVISSITMCNSGTATDTVTITVSAAGASTALKDYIYNTLSIAAKDTFIATVGITLGATDVVRCTSTSGNTVFNLFGVERNPVP